MQSVRFAALGVIVLFPFSAAQGQGAAELQSTIDKAIKAVGGAEVLEKFQKQKGKQEGTYHGGGAAMPFTATFASAAPDKFRMEIPGAFTVVLNGDKGWIATGGAALEMDEQQLKEQQEEQHIGWVMSLVPLAKERDKFKLSSIDGEPVNERETVGVKVEADGHREVKLYFDKESYDLLKAVYQIKAPELGYQEVKQEVMFSNFKDIDGARMATDVLIHRDGQKFVEAKVFDLEAVDEFPEGTFSEPK